MPLDVSLLFLRTADCVIVGRTVFFGVGIWAYSLAISAIIALLLGIFTDKKIEPVWYKVTTISN
jgi:hypothetical protein